MTSFYILICVAAWTVISVIYFISNLGNKNKKSPWYEWIIMPPTLIIAFLIGIASKLRKKK